MNFYVHPCHSKKISKNLSTFSFQFISQQIFTGITPAICHFKVYKMGFSGKKKFIIETQDFPKK